MRHKDLWLGTVKPMTSAMVCGAALSPGPLWFNPPTGKANLSTTRSVWNFEFLGIVRMLIDAAHSLSLSHRDKVPFFYFMGWEVSET